MRQRLEPRIVKYGLERRDVTGACPIIIMRGHEAEESRDCLALLPTSLARRNDPAVAADELDVAPPEPRIGEDGIALVQRPPGRFRFLLERTDHPRARRVDPALATDERRDRARCVHVLRTQALRIDSPEKGRNLHANRRVQSYMLRVWEEHRALRHHVGV